MTSIYLRNIHKKYHNKILTYTQETNTTSHQFEDKTKSSLIQPQPNNYKILYKQNYYLKRYENYFLKKLVIKYNILPQEYNLMQLDNFISAKYCHKLAIFKEKLIYNDMEEFLKDYYNIKQSKKEIPILTEFYKSYLNYFCFPTFSELRLNDLVEEMIEKKAKIFYNENYKDENKKTINNNISLNNIIIFTEKIKHDLSKENTLTEISKTTIKSNNISKSGSLNSISTINNILNFLNTQNIVNDNTLINLKTKSNLLLYSRDNIDLITDRNKKNNFVKNNENLKNDFIKINNCSTERNNKKSTFNLKKGNKNKNTNKINIIKIIRDHYLIKNNQTNKKGKIMTYKNISNKINYNTINHNNNKIKIKKNNLINKIINTCNKSKEYTVKIKNEKEKGNNTDRIRRHSIRNIENNSNKEILKKFDQKFQSFLKIALNFNKISPNKKSKLYLQKHKYKDSKISLTDRNKSIKLKYEVNNNSYKNSNLNMYIKFNKKNSIKSIKNKPKNINPVSRNYIKGFENIKTSITKNSLKRKLKENIIINSSRKKLNPYLNFKKKSKNNNNTHKILKISKEASYLSRKERSHLTTINLSKINSKSKNKKISNLKNINVKRALLPINRINKLIIKNIDISNNNSIKKQTTLRKIKIQNM